MNHGFASVVALALAARKQPPDGTQKQAIDVEMFLVSAEIG
jgi:hypothetical protein